MPYLKYVFDDEVPRDKTWDATDIKMAIKRYLYRLERSDQEQAKLELEFLKSIHREWSLNPLMRRTDPAGIAIIDDFLKWLEITPLEKQSKSDFIIRRLLK